MKYFPILQELLESDLYLFFLIGIVTAFMTGMLMKNRKKTGIGIGISLGIYFICEVVENVRTNYMLEIVLLILGVLALGAAAGYLIEFIFHTYKIMVRRKRTDGSGQNDLE